MLGSYVVKDRTLIKSECASRLRAFGSVYGMLDEPRKFMLVCVLVQYLAVEYIDPNDDDCKCSYSAEDVVMACPLALWAAVEELLSLFMLMLNAYGSKEFTAKWDNFWHKDKVLPILENEGFR